MGDAISAQERGDFAFDGAGMALGHHVPGVGQYQGVPEASRRQDHVGPTSQVSGAGVGSVSVHPLSEVQLISELVRILDAKARRSLLLSDLGALLPGQLRSGVKERGGLRSWLQRHRELFRVSGQPGKESVTLLLGGPEKPPAADTQAAQATGQEASAEPDLVGVAAGDAAAGGSLEVGLDKEAEGEFDCEAAVQLRGLPYRATVNDVKAFLGTYVSDLKDESGVQIVYNRDGRPSGFARVQLRSRQAAKDARDALHNQVMKLPPPPDAPQGQGASRYIEVFLYSERPNKLRCKRPYSDEASMIAAAVAEGIDPEALNFTPSQVIEECREYMSQPGRGKLLLSMLGVSFSPGARLFLKTAEHGLKHILAQHPDEFAIEGAKGRECVTYLKAYPRGTSDRKHVAANVAQCDAEGVMMPQFDASTGKDEAPAVPSSPRPSGKDSRRWEVATPLASPTPFDSERQGLRTPCDWEGQGLRTASPRGSATPFSDWQKQGMKSVQGIRTPSDWGTPKPLASQHLPGNHNVRDGNASVPERGEGSLPTIIDGNHSRGILPPFVPVAPQPYAYWPPQMLVLAPPQPFGRPVQAAPWPMCGAVPWAASAVVGPPPPVPAIPAVGAPAPAEHAKRDAPWPGAPDKRRAGAAAPAVKLRGLPFACTEQDVLAFFAKHDVVELIAEEPAAVRMLTKANGKPSGQAVVQLNCRTDVESARQALHGKYISSRYVEVLAHDEGEPAANAGSADDAAGKPIGGGIIVTDKCGELAPPGCANDFSPPWTNGSGLAFGPRGIGTLMERSDLGEQLAAEHEMSEEQGDQNWQALFGYLMHPKGALEDPLAGTDRGAGAASTLCM